MNNPGPERLVDGVTECSGAGLDRDDLGTEELHSEDVEGLAADIFGAHVDGALHAELCAYGCSGHTVLACTGLGDDFGLSEAASDQNLAEGVVDLVGTSVVEILTLEPDVGTVAVLGEALGKMELARAAHVWVV